MRNETVCMGKTLFAGLALLWAWTAVAEDVVVNITSAEYVIASTDDAYAQALLAGDKTKPQSLLLLCDFKPVGEVSCPGHETKYGWSTRQEAQMPVTLPAGRHILRFVFNGGYNLTDFTFEKR